MDSSQQPAYNPEKLSPNEQTPTPTIIIQPHPLNHSEEPKHIYDIMLIRQTSQSSNDQQLAQHIDLTSIIHYGNILMADLLRLLQKQMNVVCYGQEILLLLSEGEIYVNFGVSPFLADCQFDVDEFVCSNLLTLKLKKIKWNLIHLQLANDASELLKNGPPKLIQKQTESTEKKVKGEQIQTKRKNIKNFQKIGYIVKKVLKVKSKERTVRDSMELINDRVMTKKSIQDYYYQIKLGHKFNFDFNENSAKDMKFLRNFVKQHTQQHLERIRKHKQTQNQLSKIVFQQELFNPLQLSNSSQQN